VGRRFMLRELFCDFFIGSFSSFFLFLSFFLFVLFLSSSSLTFRGVVFGCFLGFGFVQAFPVAFYDGGCGFAACAVRRLFSSLHSVLFRPSMFIFLG